MDRKQLDRAADALRASTRPVAFTGAGMSAESGINTFRNSKESLWSRWQPELLATEDGFQEDKALVWGWFVWRMAKILSTAPHTGHLALAEIERRFPEFSLATQNVDNLRERAGNSQISHLHGSIFAHRCFDCGHAADFTVPLEAADNPQLRLLPPICT